MDVSEINLVILRWIS